VGNENDLSSIETGGEYRFGLIAPFSPDVVRSPYLEELIESIMQELLTLDYDMDWIMIRDKVLESYDLDTLLKQHPYIDGFVVLCWRHFPKLIAELEKRQDIPTVLINDFDPNVSLSNIYCNNKSGIQQIFSHFLSRGFKKIGMIKGPEYVSPDARERFEEFKKCAEESKIELDETYIYESSRFDELAGYHVMRFWLQRGNLPEAIFCANDDLARGSIMALQEKNIKVPDDIAIAGFDDSKRHMPFDPPLTTVRQPLTELGSVAVQALQKLVQKKENPPIRLCFEPTLVVRKSA